MASPTLTDDQLLGLYHLTNHRTWRRLATWSEFVSYLVLKCQKDYHYAVDCQLWHMSG